MVSTGGTPDGFRDAMRRYASGVTLITVHSADQLPIGMTATAFSSVSMDPVLVLICVHNETRTYDRLLRSGYFGVNMLAAEAAALSAYCARPGGTKVLPREWLLDTPQWTAPAVAGSLAFLDCEIYRHFPAGSHRVVIGQVRGVGLDQRSADPSSSSAPLVHYQGMYHTVQPMSPQENPPMPHTIPLAPPEPVQSSPATNGSAS